VGTIRDSTSEAWTKRRFLRATLYLDAAGALEALSGGQLDAVVYDAPVLRYLVRTKHGGVLTVLPVRVERQDYAFALPEGSALQESIDQEILEITASPEWDRTLARYLGE
jgi:ABC-type amino acid transport substrate-binding protein